MLTAATSGGESMRVQISPKYFSEKLQAPTLEDLIDVFEDRMRGWMLEPAERLASTTDGSFAALAVAISYFEGVCVFIQGESGKGHSRWYFIDAFLRIFPKSEPGKGMEGKTIPPKYQRQVADKLYTLARCGLYHQGMTKRGIYITDKIDCPYYISTHSVTFEVEAILINIKLMLESLRAHFCDYISQLRDAKNTSLRKRFKQAWDLSHAGDPIPLPPFSAS